jgi:hypothetical protein
MQGIKEIGSYDNPAEIGYTEWIRTKAGCYFVRTDNGEIVGPYPNDEKPGAQEEPAKS